MVVHNWGSCPSHSALATLWPSAWQPDVGLVFDDLRKGFHGHEFSISFICSQNRVKGDSTRADCKEIRVYVTAGAPAPRRTRPVEAVNKDAANARVSHGIQNKRVILNHNVRVDSDHPFIVFEPALCKAFN
jgi:hypothetical protein